MDEHVDARMYVRDAYTYESTYWCIDGMLAIYECITARNKLEIAMQPNIAITRPYREYVLPFPSYRGAHYERE